MSEVKDNTNELINTLMLSYGYTEAQATKATLDVLGARIIVREANMQKYIGKRVKANFEGLLFDVIVKDVKINHEGKTELQVTPLNGSKSTWIKNFSL